MVRYHLQKCIHEEDIRSLQSALELSAFSVHSSERLLVLKCVKLNLVNMRKEKKPEDNSSCVS